MSKIKLVGIGIVVAVLLGATIWGVVYSKRWASVRATHTQREVFKPVPNKECVESKSATSVAICLKGM